MTRDAEAKPRGPKRWLRAVLALAALSLAASCIACSPIYVAKATIAEIGIIRARRPIPAVLADTATDADTRAKLAYVVEARRFAADELSIDVGDSYTMYSRLERDTLAMVVSGAPKDQLAPLTWWFPVVGRVPYKGYFDFGDAYDEAEKLRRQGYDALVRPTAAFSTLGWFNDPILSTALRTDDVEVVTTVLHELSHQHLFVPGWVDFNESFATFAGRVGAIRFFCTREGSGPDSVKCLRAQARWRDYVRFSAFLDPFVDELQAVYRDPALSYDEKVARREVVFAEALVRFERDVLPTFESVTFSSFLTTPLDNATLLGRIRYYNRLWDFDALLREHDGSLTGVLEDLRARASSVDDPWDMLPVTEPPVAR